MFSKKLVKQMVREILLKEVKLTMQSSSYPIIINNKEYSVDFEYTNGRLIVALRKDGRYFDSWEGANTASMSSKIYAWLSDKRCDKCCCTMSLKDLTTCLKCKALEQICSDPCAICIEPVSLDSVVLECRHRFHHECTKKIAKEKRVVTDLDAFKAHQVKCPLCRKITYFHESHLSTFMNDDFTESDVEPSDDEY